MIERLQCSLLVAALAAVPAGTAGEPAIRFIHRDVDFVLEHSESENRFAPETMAGGLAVLDYDGDGDLDLFFTNGAELPANRKSSERYGNRLLRNDGTGKFTDVTESAGLFGERFGFGAAVADFDNDGDQDLFVAGLHHVSLYRNAGNGRFVDITDLSGITAADPDHGPLWAITGAWFDYDGDGLLDLFVVNYLDWEPGADPVCDETGVRDYCHPKYYRGTPNRLYRNEGDGRFRDVSDITGIRSHVGKGMGAAVADFDRDGTQDVFVTNDKLPNFLFRGTGRGAFEEIGFEATIALPEHGRDVSGMGLDARDIDGDGLADVVYAALPGETFPLMKNTPDGYFIDSSRPSGLAAQTRDMAGYAAVIADFDNDGLKDIFFSRGDVQSRPTYPGGQARQPNSVFRNRGDGTFAAMTEEAGFASAPPQRHRGAAPGDFNGDGKLDVVVTALGVSAGIWFNESPGENHWLAVELEGSVSNRDGIGAEVRVKTENRMQFNLATSSVGYASSFAGPIHFGLGEGEVVESVQVRWPSGKVQTVVDVEVDTVLFLRETDSP